MENLRNIGLAIISLGALAALGIMLSAASAVDGLSALLVTLGFCLWALLPFIILLVLTLFIHRRGFSRAARLALFLTSILVVISSVWIYWTSIFHSASSTSALVFLFIPFYSLLVIGVSYALSWLLLRLVTPKPQM